MYMSHYQNAGQSCNMTDSRSLKNVAQFKYLGMIIPNQNYVHK